MHAAKQQNGIYYKTHLFAGICICKPASDWLQINITSNNFTWSMRSCGQFGHKFVKYTLSKIHVVVLFKRL